MELQIQLEHEAILRLWETILFSKNGEWKSFLYSIGLKFKWKHLTHTLIKNYLRTNYNHTKYKFNALKLSKSFIGITFSSLVRGAHKQMASFPTGRFHWVQRHLLVYQCTQSNAYNFSKFPMYGSFQFPANCALLTSLFSIGKKEFFTASKYIKYIITLILVRSAWLIIASK